MELTETDMDLLYLLKDWRFQEAKKRRIPPYCIFHDATLKTIVSSKPNSVEDLSKIKGVGDSRLKNYGTSVVNLIQEFIINPESIEKVEKTCEICEDKFITRNDNYKICFNCYKEGIEVRTNDFINELLNDPRKILDSINEKKITKPKPKKKAKTSYVRKKPMKLLTKTIQTTYELYSKNMPIPEISQQRGLSVSTIFDHISSLIALNMVNIEHVISTDRQNKIRDAISNADSERLKPIKQLLPQDYSYGEIKCILKSIK